MKTMDDRVFKFIPVFVITLIIWPFSVYATAASTTGIFFLLLAVIFTLIAAAGLSAIFYEFGKEKGKEDEIERQSRKEGNEA